MMARKPSLRRSAFLRRFFLLSAVVPILLMLASCGQARRVRQILDTVKDRVLTPPGPGPLGGVPGRWEGKTIDEPFTTSQIKLVETRSVRNFQAEFYRNYAYPCAIKGSDYQSFVIMKRDDATEGSLPLWVYLHGGGVENTRGESFNDLLTWPRDTGLMRMVLGHRLGFRLLIPSLCSDDQYSGVGVPDPAGEYNPAQGLLATQAAIEFAREKYPTSATVLHGTSSGSIGAIPVAYALERKKKPLSAVVMDSGVFGEALVGLVRTGCPIPQQSVEKQVHDFRRKADRIGPVWQSPENQAERIVRKGGIRVLVMMVWNRGDRAYCGEKPVTIADNGQRRTMGGADSVHRDLAQAIKDNPPGGASETMRMCVNDPRSSVPCSRHSPTRMAYDQPVPPGDQDHGGRDYNGYIFNWILRVTRL